MWVIVVIVVLGLAAGAWWSAGRARPRTRIDRAARQADADAAAQRERMGIHEPPTSAGL
jgi:hypothetical protein